MSDPIYIVGIDLGTTNCVVSYALADTPKGQTPEIRIFEIPQLIDAGTVEKRRMLPSFLLVPGEYDVPEGALSLPWDVDRRTGIGEFARERGAELPQRLISSAKSWLCHTLVDRNSPILPWEGPNKDSLKLSPVEASASLLAHIREAWNYTMAADDERLRLEHQDIFLTVPASFDAVARELTVKAANMAGFSHITLLEEPQAAFYAWIEARGDRWRDFVQKGDLVLVCDIGGGTSDFSLIRVSEEDGDLALERIAVGNHLLVGGDNMDLSLAYAVAGMMSRKGVRLDSWQLKALWHSCRKAKETMLSEPQREHYPLTILGRGSSLIGGTLKAELGKDTVDQVILDGFFPVCDKSARPVEQQKVGIQELGLKYESDPAITHHLADFVSRHLSREQKISVPTAILFNGGVVKAEPIRKRILDVMSSWQGPEGSTGIREMESEDFDLSVARGAAYYGLTRRGQGIRIRGGLGRTYYIGVAASLPAVPGMPAPIKALCVAPFGMEEGTAASVGTQEFVLVVGEPVKFDFLGSSTRREDQIGTVVEDWEGEIEQIATVESTLDGEYGTVIPVTLEIVITEVGTLELWCVSREDGRRWHLEFNVREKESVGTAR